MMSLIRPLLTLTIIRDRRWVMAKYRCLELVSRTINVSLYRRDSIVIWFLMVSWRFFSVVQPLEFKSEWSSRSRSCFSTTDSGVGQWYSASVWIRSSYTTKLSNGITPDCFVRLSGKRWSSPLSLLLEWSSSSLIDATTMGRKMANIQLLVDNRIKLSMDFSLQSLASLWPNQLSMQLFVEFFNTVIRVMRIQSFKKNHRASLTHLSPRLFFSFAQRGTLADFVHLMFFSIKKLTENWAVMHGKIRLSLFHG